MMPVHSGGFRQAALDLRFRGDISFMSIANELSSDVAMAVLEQAAAKAERRTRILTEVVMEVHSILRHLTQDARRRRLSQLPPMPPPESSAASGGH